MSRAAGGPVGAARPPLELADRLDRVRGTWTDDEPLVLVFPGETQPVVAHVAGEWRYLSERRHVPGVADRLDLEVATLRRGVPSVEPLSEHLERLVRRRFESPPTDVADRPPGDGGETAAERTSGGRR
ncbi:hypothetical protein [Salinilacihabitans rarus]|uniref:hypothetical protein n=1 Tax=Salinilacihabitans rarus TaxID=2961596 RepID=UPI0020C861A7|nr:hypothetical protein [Salinilacihabitans rarus]